MRTVNGMISVTSTLHHQVRDVHGTQRSKFTSMISIHLLSCVPKIIQVHAFVKVIVKKSVAPVLCGHGVDIILQNFLAMAYNLQVFKLYRIVDFGFQNDKSHNRAKLILLLLLLLACVS